MEATLEELRRISNCPEGAIFSQLGLRKSVGSCCRIARTLDLRQGGEQLGRDGGRGILAKERRILLPSLGRHLVHRAAHGKEHLGRLAYYLIDEIRRGKDGEDGRRNDDDPNRRRCRIQLLPCPAGALAP